MPIGKGRICGGCAEESAKAFAQLVRHVRAERRLSRMYPKLVEER